LLISERKKRTDPCLRYGAGQVDVAVSSWNSQPFNQSLSQFENPSTQVKLQPLPWHEPIALGASHFTPEEDWASTGFPSSVPQLFESTQVRFWVNIWPQVWVSGRKFQSKQDQLGIQTGGSTISGVEVAV
jgi:hypothetical protein